MKVTIEVAEIVKLVTSDLASQGLNVVGDMNFKFNTKTEGDPRDSWQVTVFDGVEVEVERGRR